jgi:hypothetical protein
MLKQQKERTPMGAVKKQPTLVAGKKPIGKSQFEGFLSAACALVLLLASQSASYAPPNDLSGAVWTNGQFQFTLNYWSGATVVIESSPDLVTWTPMLTNSDSDQHFPITVAAPGNMAFYRTVANPVPLPWFPYALGTVGYINLNGNSQVTDSYNSADTNLSTNGQYDPAKASTNGNVASVHGIVNLGQQTIGGSLFLGPTATFDNVSGQVLGTIYDDYNVQFPDVVLPTTDTNGNPIVWQNAPGNSTSHTFTTNGYYLVNDTGTLTVAPGCTVALQDIVQGFNPAGITINGGMTNSGTIILYHNPATTGGSMTWGGNQPAGAIGSRPCNFIYYGLPAVTNITLSGLTTFVGVIYAPEASLSLIGGGSATGVQGSVIVSQTTGIGHYYIHFDESLITNAPVGLAW